MKRTLWQLSRLLKMLCLLACIVSRVDAVSAADAPPDSADQLARCAALGGAQFLHVPSAPTMVLSAVYHSATSSQGAFCALDGYVNPAVNFGMYLPATGWNGKLMSRGCGGSCGQVYLEGACGHHLRDGYACLHTDMGHRSGQLDNNWVANNLQGLIDFGYRATHVTIVAAKAIATAYYGRAPEHAYFYGCSTGGRQALVEAQRFADDFDGIIAVSPVAIGGFGQSNWQSGTTVNRDDDNQPILTDRQVPLIYKSVLAHCDRKDGVADGLIDPRDCDFDPSTLACSSGQSDPRRCLTIAQVDVVRRFYALGAQPGSELNWINNWTGPPTPPIDFGQDRGDPSIIDTLNNAGDPDLRAFKSRGGKLLLAHGLTDIIVTPAQTIDYYELSSRTMGGSAATREFFRLFLIPGMDHCSGGDGAWGVSYVQALEQWVEHGHAPDRLIGYRPKPGVALDYFGLETAQLKPEQIAFSRPYFPYPLKAYYSGHGDSNEAANFVPALAPINKLAGGTRGATPATPAALASGLVELMQQTEAVYVASGLPPKNVQDRVGKTARRFLYTSGAADSVVRAALQQARQAPVSDLLQSAITSLDAEYAE